MNHFLINEPIGFPNEAIDDLQRNGKVYFSDVDYPQEKITVVFVRLAHRIGIEFHRKHPKIKWIVTPTTGVNHIDTDYFRENKIKILSLRGQTEFLDKIHATAEHTLALVLSLFRKIPSACSHVQDGGWNRYPFQGRELNGKTVTILGFGRIGRQVSKLYSAFGCRVLAIDRHPNVVPDSLQPGEENPYQSADILSIHINYEKENLRFVGDKILSQLGKNCIIVNTARGEVLDQYELFRKIVSGQLGGAALDVLNDEPDPFKNKITRDNISACGDRLIVTPHIAGFTKESLFQVEKFITKILLTDIQNNS
jgi:D-3-phosphoglycerate dehydrogenase